MAGVILLSRSTRPCESTHGHAWAFSEQAIASNIDDSRYGMSDGAFRTVPPTGGLSCIESSSSVTELNSIGLSCPLKTV